MAIVIKGVGPGARPWWTWPPEVAEFLWEHEEPCLCHLRELASVKGIGRVKAAQLKAAIELGKRVVLEDFRERKAGRKPGGHSPIC